MVRRAVAPRVGPRRAEVLTRRHRARALVLLLVLDLGNLVRVLVVPIVPAIIQVLLPVEEAPPELTQVIPLVAVLLLIDLVVVVVIVMMVVVKRMMMIMVVIMMGARELVFFQRLLQQLRTATWGPGNGWRLLRGPFNERICIRRRVPIAEIRTVPTPADAPRHPGLLDGLADQHAVLLELLRQDGIEERVAARVERQYEDGEDLGLLQGNQMQSEGGRQGEKGNRRPADKVRKDQQGHPLGDSRVVAVPRLRAAYRAVHLQVAPHEDQERHTVDEHEENHVRQAARPRRRLEGQADGKLAIVGDAEQRHDGHGQSKCPSDGHNIAGVAQGEALIQMHRMGYGVIALQRDHSQRIDGQLGGEDGQKSGQLTARTHLPGNGKHSELAQGGGVHHRQDPQIDAHEKVGGRQIADKESRHVHFRPGEDENKYDGSVSQHRQQEHDPHATSQCPPVK